ncbi:MAG: hypothetical protein EXS14_08990 [Planctomycetes bacterium]|nr:hypothetical protein [Planctomycetota bacterium]
MLKTMLPLLLVLTLFVACGDDVQFVAPPGAVAETAAHEHAHDASDPFADAADAHAADQPAANTEGGAATSADAKPFFSGRVELAAGFTLPATYTVYVMAGPPPKGRPPLLSRRYDKPSFPLDFTLEQGDIPFKDSKVEGPQVLSVILSERGPVMATDGVYLRCPLAAAQAVGATGIVLTIRN